MIASYSPPKLEYAKLDSPSSKASPDLPSRSGLVRCSVLRAVLCFTCGALFYVRCSVLRAVLCFTCGALFYVRCSVLRAVLCFTCGALFYVRCSVSRLYMQLLYVVSMAQTAIYLDSKGPAGILRGLRGFGLSKIGA